MARRSKELTGSQQERVGWQRECASLKDAVDGMRLQRKVEQQQQQQRVTGLKASLEERQQLLATTQAANPPPLTLLTKEPNANHLCQCGNGDINFSSDEYQSIPT